MTRETLRHAADLRTAAAAALVGCAVFALASTLPNVGLLDDDQVGDTPGYREDGEAILRGAVPYRDFYLEYPPGSLPVFVLPALGNGNYAARFKLLSLVLGLALVVVVVAGLAYARAPPQTLFAGAVLIGAAPAALGPVFLVNYDVWPALLTTTAVVALAAERGRLGFALLAVGVAAKAYPVLLLPIAWLRVRAVDGAREAWRGLGIFAAVLGLCVLPFALVAPGAIGFDLWVALRRPLQVESLGGTLLLVADRLGLYDANVNSSFNSQNLDGSAAGALATAFAGVGLVMIVLVVAEYSRRAASAERFVLAAAAAVVAAVAFGKLLSPQYLIWVAPLVVLTTLRSAWALLLAALVLTQLWFPSRYGELVAAGRIAWVALARDLVLVALAVLLLRRVRA